MAGVCGFTTFPRDEKTLMVGYTDCGDTAGGDICIRLDGDNGRIGWIRDVGVGSGTAEPTPDGQEYP